MGGVLGLIGGKMQFQGWYEGGNLVTSSVAGAVTIDGPHTLTAKWQVDHTFPITILVGIVVLAALNYVAARKARRPSNQPQELFHPAQKVEPQKTRRRTPAARTRSRKRSG